MQKFTLIKDGSEMKLHLGCGQVYLKGYVNIDFPLDHHSVQTKSIADEQKDILKLSYKPESIEEIRLHHLFEHFPRTTYLALLVSWRQWLSENGVLHIEVPDFEKMAKIAISRFSDKKAKRVALRHIFGSNEESWAVHYEGWSEELFRDVLVTTGFEVTSIKRNNWRGTHNIEVIAKKSNVKQSLDAAREKVSQYLSSFLIDTQDEKDLLEIWLGQYDKQLTISCRNLKK